MSTISTDELINNIKKINDKYQELVFLLMQGKGNFIPQVLIDNAQAKEMIMKSFNSFIEKPDKFLDLNIKYIEEFKNLLNSSIDKFIGREVDPIYTPDSKDKRFKDSNWQENIYFDFVKQFYLMTSKWTQDYIDQCNLEPKLKEYLEFQVKQFINACSPTNFIISNPVVFKETVETGWQNIVQGLDNFLNDIKSSGDVLNITTTNTSHFEVGKNIAATKGKVVYRNELIELICYKPQKQAYSIPILVVPPWINKYYILDLSEQNSLIKFLVDCHFQVFLISWINPDQKLAHKNFEDYVNEGVLASYNYLSSTFGYYKINAMGYCIGGTLLAVTMAYSKKINLDFINSASLLTTLLDFSDPGELGIFINDLSIAAIELEMESKGYFDGKYLSNSFSLLKANDLIWSFFVNNYLLGKKPLAFDILFWNSDSTNLPAKMHSFYLRNMYLNNLLKVPGGIKILGKEIDLSLISEPTFFLAAEEDHIAPWSSVYYGLKLLNGKKTFCLAGSGHVAGVINPLISEKYSYRTGEIESHHDQWLLKSKELKGSWWQEWKSWLHNHSGQLEKSLNYDEIFYIEFAPGSYVK